MNIIQRSVALPHYWKELIFLVARLKTEAKTQHLAPAVETYLATYSEIMQAEQDVEFQEAMGRAQIKTSEVRIEKGLRKFYSATLHDVNQNRKDQRYKLLFKKTLNQILRMSLSARQKEIVQMKDVLELTHYSDEFRNDQIVVLDEILSEIKLIQDADNAIDKRRMHHRVAVEQWKDQTNALRMDVYSELIAIAPEHEAKSWPRSFFMVSKVTAKLSEEELAIKNAKRTEKAAQKSAATAAAAADKSRKALEKLKKEAEKAAKIAQEKADAAARLEDAARRRAAGDSPPDSPAPN